MEILYFAMIKTDRKLTLSQNSDFLLEVTVAATGRSVLTLQVSGEWIFFFSQVFHLNWGFLFEASSFEKDIGQLFSSDSRFINANLLTCWNVEALISWLLLPQPYNGNVGFLTWVLVGILKLTFCLYWLKNWFLNVLVHFHWAMISEILQ